MSAQGVFTRMKRVTFVKGEITSGTPAEGFVACGALTSYPMEVTGASQAIKLDKIAEIFHRVKDAWFVGGTMMFLGDDTIYAATTAPTNRAHRAQDELAAGAQERGYTHVIDDPLTIPANLLPYLTAEYDRGDGEMWRDISDNERGIFLFPRSAINYFGAETSIDEVTAFRYGSYAAPFTTTPSTAPLSDWFYSKLGPGWTGGVYYYDERYDECLVVTQIGSEIAYVLAAPGDTIYSPGTKFFLHVEFSFIASEQSYMASTIYGTDGPNNTNVVCNYILRLSTGDLSCPIYSPDVGGGLVSPTGSDFIHAAQEWFPYAKTGGAVWNSTTGAKL